MTKKTTIILNQKDVELPITVGSENEKAINISSLRKNTGYITLDPSYANTGSCKSSITFIDGEKGILRYRGYPIEQLAEHSSFVEVMYLLLYGELPTNRNYIRINYYHTLNNGNELNFASNFSTATGFAMGSYGPLFQDSFSSTTSIKYNSSS